MSYVEEPLSGLSGAERTRTASMVSSGPGGKGWSKTFDSCHPGRLSAGGCVWAEGPLPGGPEEMRARIQRFSPRCQRTRLSDRTGRGDCVPGSYDAEVKRRYPGRAPAMYLASCPPEYTIHYEPGSSSYLFETGATRVLEVVDWDRACRDRGGVVVGRTCRCDRAGGCGSAARGQELNLLASAAEAGTVRCYRQGSRKEDSMYRHFEGVLGTLCERCADRPPPRPGERCRTVTADPSLCRRGNCTRHADGHYRCDPQATSTSSARGGGGSAWAAGYLDAIDERDRRTALTPRPSVTLVAQKIQRAPVPVRGETPPAPPVPPQGAGQGMVYFGLAIAGALLSLGRR